MTQRNRQAPPAEQLRTVSIAGTGRSISKRKDRVPSPQQAEAEAPATDVRSRIEKLAYALYQQRGGEDGNDRQDWLEAERIVQASSAPQSHDGSSRLVSPSLHIA